MAIDRVLEAVAEMRRPKTKIVCTLGPSSRSVDMLEKLLKAGMNVARFNFSHGTHDYHQETLDNLRTAMVNTDIVCAVMLDTKGPEIRTGFLKDGKAIHLQHGQEITITTDYTILGDEKMISMSYKRLALDVKPQTDILCADGKITLKVLACDRENGLVHCRCENSAELGEKKNVNLPGVIVDLPTLTKKDRADILEWGVPNKIDMIALSFVRKGSDLDEVRRVLGDDGRNIMLMSKVENQEGVSNFDEIIANTDAFMVARGDLGMEIPIENIFLAQKMMIAKANKLGKPVVTATQMLESMVQSPRPTRAEATDVANAVLDGTDCVMLSGETAAGAYPETAVQTMARICVSAEDSINYDNLFKKKMKAAPKSESWASSAVQAANGINAALILALDNGAAKVVAKYRPSMTILTLSDDEAARAGHSLIYRGVLPLPNSGSFTEEVAIENAKAKGICKAGDLVVVLTDGPLTDKIKIVTV